MSQPPLVSIIVPFYNAEPFFEAAIQSVLAQTYTHWELLLVDDGSQDGSTAIAQRYVLRHPERIRYQAHEGRQNRGKSTTRNLGIRHARGEYLAFLDADDIFLPYKLARQVALLEAQPTAGMLYGRTEYWFDWPGAPATRQRNYLSTLVVKPNRLYVPPALLTTFLRNSGAVPCICSLLARRSLVMQIGMFDERIQHLYEDQVLLAKLCLAAPVFVEDGCGERYRQHAASSSNVARQTGDYHPWLPDPSGLRYLNWLSDYLPAHGIADAALLKALQRAFEPYRHPLRYRLTLPLKMAHSAVSASLTALAERVRLTAGVTEEQKL